MESNNHGNAARKHLEIVRRERATTERQSAHYVRLAYSYGVDVWEISRISAIPVEQVRRMLVGSAQSARD